MTHKLITHIILGGKLNAYDLEEYLEDNDLDELLPHITADNLDEELAEEYNNKLYDEAVDAEMDYIQDNLRQVAQERVEQAGTSWYEQHNSERTLAEVLGGHETAGEYE